MEVQQWIKPEVATDKLLEALGLCAMSAQDAGVGPKSIVVSSRKNAIAKAAEARLLTGRNWLELIAASALGVLYVATAFFVVPAKEHRLRLEQKVRRRLV